MLAAGQGKQPKPWAPPQPITKIREPTTCRVHATLCPTATPLGRVQPAITLQGAHSGRSAHLTGGYSLQCVVLLGGLAQRRSHPVGASGAR